MWMWLAAAGLAATGLVSTYLLRPRVPGWTGLRHLGTCPPVWLGAIAGLLVGMDASSAWVVNAIGIPFVIWLAIVVRRLARSRLATPPPWSAVDEDSLGNAQDLLRWLGSDDAIRTPQQDQFGGEHTRIAGRMAARLCQDPLPSQRLAGVLGSGKTSVRRLVEAQLADHRPSVLIVNVSMWSYESAEAAARGTLRAILDRLSAEIPIWSIRGVPNEYVRAIEQGGPRAFAVVAGLARRNEAPEVVVGRVASRIRGTGLRIVVWVEDIERFAEGQSSAALGPLLALLYLIEQEPNMTVVLAATPCGEHQQVDPAKLARFGEEIPPLDVDATLTTLARFRQSQLGGTFVRSSGLEAEQTEQLDRRSRGLYMGIILREMWGTDPHPAAALATLVSTPRHLKDALRHCRERWEVLAGEIEFDDLLFASVLRVTAPDVYSLLSTRAVRTDLRSGRRREEGRRTGGLPTGVELVQEAINEVDEPARRQAVRLLVDALFPGWAMDGVGESRTLNRPQGVQQSYPGDYWARMDRGQAIPWADSDQRVLKAIETFRLSRDGELAALARDSKLRSRVMQFVLRLESEDAEELLRQLLQPTTEPQLCDGVSTAGNLLRHVRVPQVPLRNALVAAVPQLLPDHPKALYHLHGLMLPGNGAALAPLESSELANDVRNASYGRLLSLTSDEFTRLTNVLDADSLASLVYTCVGRYGSTQEDRRERLAETVQTLNTAVTTRGRDKLAIAVAILAFDEDRSPDGPRVIIRDERIRSLLGNHAVAFAQEVVNIAFDPSATEARYVSALVEWATEVIRSAAEPDSACTASATPPDETEGEDS